MVVTSNDAIVTYGDLYARNGASGQTPAVEVISAAIAAQTLEVANESWQRQYDRFLDVFA